MWWLYLALSLCLAMGIWVANKTQGEKARWFWLAFGLGALAVVLGARLVGERS